MKVVGKISLGLTAVMVVHLASGVQNMTMTRRPTPPTRGTHALRLAPATNPNEIAPGAPAEDPNAFKLPPDNPYGTIVARNIFGLVPIPPPDPPKPPDVDPPPKITANGIMNVLGDLQALFKVTIPAKDKNPAKDQSYMLSQGQMQDDIEVLKIDAINGTITFNNHGVTQEIPLVAADKSSGGGGNGGGLGGSQPGAFNPGGFGHPMGGGGSFSGVGGPGNAGFAQNGSPNASQNNSSNGSGGGNPQIYQPDLNSDLTPEQSAVLIEAQRALLQQQQQNGQTPAYNPSLLPTTKYTPPPEGNQGAGERP